ncbi:MAG: SpoIIE family protein phosphatase [Bacteroidota bacterium]
MKSSRSHSAFSSDLFPLFEYAKIINSSSDLRFILSTLLLTVMGKMLVSRGVVLLKRERGWFEIVAAKGVEQDLIGHTIPVQKPSRSIVQLDRLPRGNHTSAGFFSDRKLKLLIPVIVRKDLVGLISLGEPLGKKKYSRLDNALIRSLVDLSGSAIEKAMMIEQLQEVNRSLDRKYQELNTLFDLSKEFNIGLNAERVLRLLTFSLLGQVGVNRYAVCLLDRGTVNVVSSRLDTSTDLSQAYNLCCTLKTPAHVSELLRQKKYKSAAREFEQAGIVAIIPMQVQNETKGLILLGKKLRGGEYTAGDLEFLYSLANLAIISIENARLFHDAIEKQRMEDELAIAREIQQGLLPRTLQQITGFDLAAVNIPSKQVGGDYYDVIRNSDSEVIIAIGDVSGKGTPAALLMANVQASLRALAPMGLSLSEATSRINNLTCLNTTPGKFITFFWGALDIPTRSFRYVNAGHNLPFLFRADGSLERLEAGGMILGMMETISPYEEGTIVFERGDLLVLFTDGVSEAMNAGGNDFTEERLEETIRATTYSSAQEVIGHIQRELHVYTQGTPQSDDITMLVLKAL